MDIHEAARALRNMNRKAPTDQKTISLILFGIKYANEIRSLSMTELQNIAQIPKIDGSGPRVSISVEVNQGIAMSQYVKLQDDIPNWI